MAVRRNPEILHTASFDRISAEADVFLLYLTTIFSDLLIEAPLTAAT